MKATYIAGVSGLQKPRKRLKFCRNRYMIFPLPAVFQHPVLGDLLHSKPNTVRARKRNINCQESRFLKFFVSKEKWILPSQRLSVRFSSDFIISLFIFLHASRGDTSVMKRKGAKEISPQSKKTLNDFKKTENRFVSQKPRRSVT